MSVFVENLNNKQVRIESKLKNNVLYRAIYDNYDSVRSFCDVSGFPYPSVIDLINLNKKAVRKNGEYREICKRLAKHFSLIEEVLFPVQVYSIKKTKVSNEVSFDMVAYENKSMICDDSQVDIAQNKALAEEIKRALCVVTKKEREVLIKRYGLFGEKPQTLQEVGDSMGVTKQRIRQIETRAIGKMRENSIVNARLKDYTDDFVIDKNLKNKTQPRNYKRYGGPIDNKKGEIRKIIKHRNTLVRLGVKRLPTENITTNDIILSLRLKTALDSMGVVTLEDMLAIEESCFVGMKNVGKKTIEEFEALMKS